MTTPSEHVKAFGYLRVSGLSQRDGDGLPRQREAIKIVVCEKLDRLARDLMIQEAIIADMQRRGFTLLSTMEPDLCSEDPSRVLIRQIFGALAQYDRAMITLKLKAAKDRMRAKGLKCDGPKPYGQLPGEMEQLTLMRELRAEGKTLDQTRAEMTARNMMARSGKPWSLGSLARVARRAELK
jgi:DNA invertase Pin-like site-specific DNA recombinase